MRTLIKTAKLLTLSATLFGCVAASSNNELLMKGDGSNVLPSVELADLEGTAYNFPKDFNSSYTALVLGFSHEQKSSTETWMDPLAKMKEGNSNFSYYKVPVIDNSSLALRTMIRNGMRSGIEGDARKKVLTLFVDKMKFAEALGIKDTNQVQVVVLNREGKIVWRGMGDADAAKVKNMSKVLNS